MLLALGEGTIGREHLAVVEPKHRGRAGSMEPAGEDPGTGRLQLLVHGIDVAHDRLERLARRQRSFGLVQREQVLLHRAFSFQAGR
jgi:hypothetical protein